MAPSSKVVFSPLQRKAEFAKAATLREKGTSQAAEDDLEVSWTHLKACLEGERTPSEELARRVAEYVGIPVAQFWGERELARAI